MAKSKIRTENIEVLFIYPLTVKVRAADLDTAMDKAEEKAAEEFRELLDKGMLGSSDFYCEAQTP